MSAPAWRLLVDPPADGAWNMAVDEAILEAYLDDPPPGFGTAGNGLQILAGSWKQVVD